MIPEGWLELWEVVSRNRMRTLLTASGVFWGMLMLVLMLGFGNGLESGVQRTIGGSVTNAVFVWGRRTSMPYRGLPEGREVSPTNAQIPVIQAVEGIAAFAPRNRLGGYRSGENVRHASEVGNYQVSGDIPAWRDISPLNIVQGRWLNERDLAERRKVAIIGQPVVDEIYAPREDVVGSILIVRGVTFTVVGVFDTDLGGEQADRAERAVYLPFTTFQESFAGYRDRVGWFAATARPEVPASVLEERIKAALAESLGLHPKDKRAFGSYNSQEEFEKVTNLFVAIRAVVWFVGVATLLSGVVGVSNILLVTIRERTREIGLRRALGATKTGIIFMVLQEALLLTGVAGYLGLVLGVMVLEGVAMAIGPGSETMGPPGIDLRAGLAGVVVVMIGGVCAGVLPARHAASIHPAAALRS